MASEADVEVHCIAVSNQVPVAAGSVPLGDRGVQRRAGENDSLLVRRSGERHEACSDGPTARDSDDGPACSLVGNDPEALSDSFVHFGPRLHAGEPSRYRIVRVTNRREPFTHVIPGEPLGGAGMNLARVATPINRRTPDSCCDGVGSLLRSEEKTRLHDVGVGQLAGLGKASSESGRLVGSAWTQPGAR